MALTGSCLCGAVRFTVAGPLSPPVACHCVQCRKGSGHHTASTTALRSSVAITGSPRWYALKPTVRRGFCADCGTPLFWDSAREPDRLSIELGAIDGPTGLRLAGHMYIAEKGDYYDLPDDLPLAAGEWEEGA